MADSLGVYNANSLVHTGKGQLTGIVISCSGAAALATFYDNTTNAGTKLLEAHVSNYTPLVIFFSDQYAPRFVTGLYIALAANLTATLWTRKL